MSSHSNNNLMQLRIRIIKYDSIFFHNDNSPYLFLNPQVYPPFPLFENLYSKCNPRKWLIDIFEAISFHENFDLEVSTKRFVGLTSWDFEIYQGSFLLEPVTHVLRSIQNFWPSSCIFYCILWALCTVAVLCTLGQLWALFLFRLPEKAKPTASQPQEKQLCQFTRG